jgi:hypothetical protein
MFPANLIKVVHHDDFKWKTSVSLLHDKSTYTTKHGFIKSIMVLMQASMAGVSHVSQ